ncbi:tRNA-dihydrouridine synthase C [Pseudomonas aeruginosa]|nr:tRNA-dihydrouridine synthase C [Pseudomonas aeruginosa]
MEGLVDEILRDVLTRVGGIDWCVTEFIRITDRLLPATAFHKLAPELRDGSRTRAGTPMRVQLLGSDPACLADNAAFACELGAPVIDLNFGCPAKTVNRSRGGAVLLKEPELMHDIVAAVRRAGAERDCGDLEDAPGLRQSRRRPGLCAGPGRRRLGPCSGACPDQGRWLQAAGALEWVARVAEAVRVPVFANGEVWTLDDYLRCREVSGVEDIMLGRGLVSRPGLARQIAAWRDGGEIREMPWSELLPLLRDFWLQARRKLAPRYAPGRLKQWLGMLTRTYPKPSSCSRGFAGKAIAKPSTGCCRCRSARRPSLRSRPSGRR